MTDIEFIDSTQSFHVARGVEYAPIGDLNIRGLGKFTPQDDITPLEAVLIVQMLVVVLFNAYVECVTFVEKHGLQRHFTKEPS